MPSAAPTRALARIVRISEAVETYGAGAMAGRTGACAQARDLPTGPYQTRLHTEGQWQFQATGHLNPLRDRVCMTAAMLVLEPIFEADLPSELLRLPSWGETPNRWSRRESRCFAPSEVVDADAR